MKKIFKSLFVATCAATAFIVPLSVSATSTLPAPKTTVICPKCYNYNAKLVCNREGYYEGTYYHGNCHYNVFTSTVSVDCDQCNQFFQLDSGRHACWESHLSCGLGVVTICGADRY